MKSLPSPPAKRRWKSFATCVLALVFLSMLVPLAFLLGLHNRSPSGYSGDDRAVPEEGFGGPPVAVGDYERNGNRDEKEDLEELLILKQPIVDENTKPCELEFGAYCIWSSEHKEEMKDSVVKKLKDQLFVARAYYPSIAKLQSQENFTREVKKNIQDHERMLSEAIVDADLPKTVMEKIETMEETIAKAKSLNVDCHNVDKKLRQILDFTEDEAYFHRRQSAFLYHLGVHTLPKSLHCLSMRLTVEYFKHPFVDKEKSHVVKLDKDNPAIHHYIVFSKNILASSVTVNSTVMNAKESKNLVFHILTDEENFYAMKFWFSRNSYRDALVDVVNIEHLKKSNTLKQPHMSFSEEFRISIHDSNQSSLQTRTEYLSVFGHAHFLLSDFFKNVRKVVVLDDDVVVQRDLSSLWDLDLKGKVIGAAQFCKVRLVHLQPYLPRNVLNDDSCTWMSGLNIVDLEKWRESGTTDTYHTLLKEALTMNTTTSWRAAALPISLLAFQNLTYPLEDAWVLSGLGKDYGIDSDAIENVAVLHYNGNMKPWLELGIPKYKSYWKSFLTKGNQFMDECNASP